LPQADYHNIRHHHGAGEMCPHHDHLLRWHPTASQNEDVAVLHWHWLAPQSVTSTSPADGGQDDHAPAAPPALHAYLPDCLEPDWQAEPVIRSEGRWGDGDSASRLAIALPAASSPSLHFADSPATAPPGSSFCAPTLGERGPLAHVERWDC
jgi:hypothetical protein